MQLPIHFDRDRGIPIGALRICTVESIGRMPLLTVVTLKEENRPLSVYLCAFEPDYVTAKRGSRARLTLEPSRKGPWWRFERLDP
jgi:hypothetical protein